MSAETKDGTSSYRLYDDDEISVGQCILQPAHSRFTRTTVPRSHDNKAALTRYLIEVEVVLQTYCLRVIVLLN